MTKKADLDYRFQIAFRELAEQAVRECDYKPEEYLQGIGRLGSLNAAKHFLFEPPSDDSLQLWARGKRDLTIEALALQEEWADLFLESERAIAGRRYADWSFRMTTDCSAESSDSESKHIQRREGDTEPQFFFPDDDILWGEELAAGIDVCEKLAQVNKAQKEGYNEIGDWTSSYYRSHLADCKACAQECSYVKEALEEFDAARLKSLGELLRQCVVSLRYSLTRARDLLSAEWKAGGFEWLPSEAEAAGISDYGWKNAGRTEDQQAEDWLKALHMRAGQLAAFTGLLMARYEETHIPRFGESSHFSENPWLVWRRDEASSAVKRFVRGLSEVEFLTALIAKHICELKAFDHVPPLKLPTDGDLKDVDKSLVVEKATDVETWTKLLSANFTRHRLYIHSLNFQQPDQTKSERKSRISDFSELDWERILYLASCAATKEASGVEPSNGNVPEFSPLTDRLDSISAARMIGLLEHIASNVKAKDSKAAENTLETALGSQICGFLVPEAWTNAVAAEVILHDITFPNPGVGIGTLCTAFECELKYGLLTRFCIFLRTRRINYWPDGKMEDGNWWPLLMKGGNINDRLSMERISVAFTSRRPELEEFCISEGIDLSNLRGTIGYVKEYRNPHAHGGVLTFAQAQRIRERLLGISTGNGGVLGTLVPRNVRCQPEIR
ncbi:MAG: hypothetical protein ABI693_20600 [Bryobacteraceae bacterium]